jgi:uncharacterized protein (TIGR03083 family)
MAKADVWPTVHAERRALAGDLEGLTDSQWDTPSLCLDWTVRDVVAHMTSTAKISGATFFPKLVGSGFSLTRMQAKDITRERGESPSVALQGFTSVIDSSKHPPGPGDTWLGEVLIHSEDIRRPLGVEHEYPREAVVEVAEFYKGSNLVIGAKRRITGVRLRATDAEWTTGEGPEAAGPILSLLLAMTGRKAPLDELSGDGVEVLRGRE